MKNNRLRRLLEENEELRLRIADLEEYVLYLEQEVAGWRGEEICTYACNRASGVTGPLWLRVAEHTAVQLG